MVVDLAVVVEHPSSVGGHHRLRAVGTESDHREPPVTRRQIPWSAIQPQSALRRARGGPGWRSWRRPVARARRGRSSRSGRRARRSRTSLSSSGRAARSGAVDGRAHPCPPLARPSRDHRLAPWCQSGRRADRGRARRLCPDACGNLRRARGRRHDEPARSGEEGVPPAAPGLRADGAAPRSAATRPGRRASTRLRRQPGPARTPVPRTSSGIGVQKAGTTWWYELILGPPGSRRVRGSTRNGTSSTDSARVLCGRRTSSATTAGFRAAPGHSTGEWTPDYFSFPWVPRSCCGAPLPTRGSSCCSGTRSNAFGPGSRTSTGWVLPATRPRSPTPSQRGFYDRALDGLARALRCASSCSSCSTSGAWPTATPSSSATFRHLGLEPHRPPSAGRCRDGAGDRRPIPARRRGARRTSSTSTPPTSRALAARLPDLDLARWPNFAYLAGVERSPGRLRAELADRRR